jgi:hypothetical protein
MKKPVLYLCIIAVVATGALSQLGAQGPAGSGQATIAPTLTADQALPLTCAQAWAVAGKSYGPMLAIVTTLAKVSLANRELTFPNTREAGIDAGTGIAQDCKADPQALLYAVVDKHVRRVVEARKTASLR